MPTNCSLTVNGGVASLIAWFDHSFQKTEVGGKLGHAPCRRILLQKIQIAFISQQLLNGQGVRRISGFKSKSRGIRFVMLNMGSFCGRKTDVCEELRKRRVDVWCIQEEEWKGQEARFVGSLLRDEGKNCSCQEIMPGFGGVVILVKKEISGKLKEKATA